MRKLMLFSIAFSITTFILTFFEFSDGWLKACALFFLLSIILFSFRNRNSVVIRMLCLCLGVFWGMLSFSAHQVFRYIPLEDLNETTAVLSFRLNDFPETGNGYIRVTGIIQEKERFHSEVLLYDNGYTYHLNQFRPGDVIRCQVRLRSTGERYGEPFYGSYANGIFLSGYILSEPQLTGHAETFLQKLLIFPVVAKEKITKLIGKVFAPSFRPFMSSLMINDRHDFNLNTSLSNSMSRSGIMHIVAVSGMHIAFLVGMLRLLFGSGKGISILCLLIIWLFVLVSGAPVSAVRAGIMQSMLLLAPLFRRENDPPTSLSLGLLILIMINPWAVRSVSLQLSFGAVIGILLFAQPLYQRIMKRHIPKALHALYSYFSGVICCSIGVMIVTVPVCAWHFSSVQVLSLLTNTLVLWAVSLCFCLGYLAVLLFPFAPLLGQLVALPASFFASYIIRIADWISSLPFATLYIGYADNRVLCFLIAVYALFILFHYLPLPYVHRIMIPCLLSFLLFCSLISLTKLEYQSYPSVFNVLDVGQGQCITVFSGEETVMIDCGSTMTTENAGSVAGRYLSSCQRNCVDLLVLTHLHTDHTNGIEILLDYIPVKRILILEDLVEDVDMLSSIKKAAEAHNTLVEFISKDTIKQTGNIMVEIYRSSTAEENDNERCLVCIVSVGDYDMLVTGDISQKSEEAFLKRTAVPKIDCFVLGHHGSYTSTSDTLLQACYGATGVISCGYNTYGHPSEITLEKAEKKLSALFRTDKQGTIQLIPQEEERLPWLKRGMKLATSLPKLIF